MNTAGFEKLEDCLDGSMIFRVIFEGTPSEKELGKLASLGEWEYYGNFPKPFYRLHREGEFQIKGVTGEKDARMILFSGDPGEAVGMINNALGGMG